MNGQQCVAAGSVTHRSREAASQEPEKSGKNPQKRETTYQRVQEVGQAGGAPKREEKDPTASAARGSTGQGASWTATTERRRRRVASGRGPAPKVSCSPPARYPRPPLALQRETYRLELRGSCGRVQAGQGLFGSRWAQVVTLVGREKKGKPGNQTQLR